ncbi:MAG TPA: heterodisulfide reductase-related iron-sulfur binding cluster [Mycobacteriales bacterium]|jgi:glycolate oxidase iron-sulfur subunit|nr:heterodisulfide reductase-related iron-sulfur binding cluster [Mycobacteriales bacterium]
MSADKRDLVADCVHCGFCLPSCPTYLLWGEEMDSPRGRIYLMKNVLEGAPLDDTTIGHFDACLGCMACVTSCPSGVQYDALIEMTRAEVEAVAQRKGRDSAIRRMIFALFPYPRRLRAVRPLLRGYQASGAQRIVRRRMRGSLGTMAGLVPPLGTRERLPALTSAVGEKRARVGMLLGCVQREFFPGVNAATVRVLAAEGCEVVVPPHQQCCGALSLHAGREPEAVARAKKLIAAFEAANVDSVVVNVAGCGSSMKEYGRLLAGDPEWAERAAAFSAMCRDVSELLADLGPVAERHPLPVVAAYHDACHLSHAQGVRAQPRELLRGIPGLELREISEPDICCGSAGIYNLVKPEPARELGDRKAANVRSTGAQLLVTANPGCLMQIDSALRRGGTPIALAHTVEVLDASIRGGDIGVLGVTRAD